MHFGERILILDARRESRRVLEADLRQAGLDTRALNRPDALLASFASVDRQETSCLIVDQAFSTKSPADFLAQLRQAGWMQPLIFVGREPALPDVVAAIKSGAQDFFQEPVETRSLLAAVREALSRHREAQQQLSMAHRIHLRYMQLTARECEVMALVCQGHSNKEIARHLEISPRTVENHRAHLMAKMQAHHVANLCAMAAVCLPQATSTTVAILADVA